MESKELPKVPFDSEMSYVMELILKFQCGSNLQIIDMSILDRSSRLTDLIFRGPEITHNLSSVR